MGNITQALKYWKGLDVLSMAANVVNDHSNVLADYNRKQLMQGLSGTGNKLLPYKNKHYAARKNKMNKKPGLGTPDFYLTGETHRGIFFTANEITNKVVGGSTARHDKVDFLMKRDGRAIFRLTDDNRAKARQVIQRAFIAALSKESGCK